MDFNFFRKFKLLVIIFFIALNVPAIAQNILLPDEKKDIIGQITEDWNDWNVMNISGKLRMEGLPLSPTLKIYMEKDSIIMCSIRASFFGEAGRLEITPDTVLMVNKMKKTYASLGLKELANYYPGSISDLQGLLLGRIVLPPNGELDADKSAFTEVLEDEVGNFIIMPSEEFSAPLYNYGYVVGPDLMLQALMVVPLTENEITIEMDYDFYDDGYDVTAYYISPRLSLDATLELNLPKEGGNPMDPIKINNKYRRLSFPDFLKSF